MNLEQLVQLFREDADDEVQPYLFSAQWIVARLNEAVTEACIRARLIHESLRDDVCQIPVEAGQATYPLHRSLYEITHIAFRSAGETKRAPLRLLSTEALDRIRPDWRDEEGEPEFAVQTDSQLRLVPRPSTGGTCLLEGFRTPLSPLSSNSDVPEINLGHHIHLVPWALWRAFSKPDVDYYDLDRAKAAESEFTRYFGPRPDADLRRKTREDVPHHVVPFFV